jgi:hypothetical protein
MLPFDRGEAAELRVKTPSERPTINRFVTLVRLFVADFDRILATAQLHFFFPVYCDCGLSTQHSSCSRLQRTEHLQLS